MAHEMIVGDEQTLFKHGYAEKIKALIITTGNELKGNAIAKFSEKLDRWQLKDLKQK